MLISVRAAIVSILVTRDKKKTVSSVSFDRKQIKLFSDGVVFLTFDDSY